MLFADIIIDISVKSLDRPFQYRVRDPLQEDAVFGALVDIPFGKGNQTGQRIERIGRLPLLLRLPQTGQ